jgi:hypothetical protein
MVLVVDLAAVAVVTLQPELVGPHLHLLLGKEAPVVTGL